MADTKISALTAATTPLAGTEVVPIVQGGVTVKATVASIATTTQPSGVANAIQYLDGSKVSTTSNRLTFDGSAYQTLTTQVYVNGGYVNARTAPSNGTYNTFDFVEGATTTGFLRNYGTAYGGGVTGELHLTNTQNAGIVFGVNNAEVARFNTSGNLTFPSGKGIDFSATPGTGTSELLADYEEGTWTPLISANGAGAVTFTSTAAIGRYTKVGRLVTIYCRYTYTSIGSVGNDFAFMTGLPFQALNTGMEVTGSMQVGQSSFLVRIFQPKMENNGSRILFQFDNGTGALYAGAPYMVGNSFPSSGDITILLSYFTA